MRLKVAITKNWHCELPRPLASEFALQCAETILMRVFLIAVPKIIFYRLTLCIVFFTEVAYKQVPEHTISWADCLNLHTKTQELANSNKFYSSGAMKVSTDVFFRFYSYLSAHTHISLKKTWFPNY